MTFSVTPLIPASNGRFWVMTRAIRDDNEVMKLPKKKILVTPSPAVHGVSRSSKGHVERQNRRYMCLTRTSRKWSTENLRKSHMCKGITHARRLEQQPKVHRWENFQTSSRWDRIRARNAKTNALVIGNQKNQNGDKNEKKFEMEKRVSMARYSKR
jgi:hypothetical protein